MPLCHAVLLTPSLYFRPSHLPTRRHNQLCSFHSPYTLPSSVSCKSFACHSYENCRGVYQQFPFWPTLREIEGLAQIVAEEFTSAGTIPSLSGAKQDSPLASVLFPFHSITTAKSPVRSCLNSSAFNTYAPLCMCWALLTSSVNAAMPQAVNVVGQTEQQGLADLGSQAAPGGARGELAFDGREHAFDLGALPIRFFRKSAEHLIADSTVRDTPAPSGNDALGSQALPNIFVVGFGVELRIREHHTDRSAARRHIEQPRQSTRVASPRLTRPLRQQNLLPHIRNNQPLQPRATRPGPVRMLLQAPVEKSADGGIGEPRPIDGCRNGAAPASPQPTHGFLQSTVDGVVLQPPQKTIQRGVVRHGWQVQRGAQLLMLEQAHFGFAN